MLSSYYSRILAKLWPSLPFCYHLYRLGIGVGLLAALEMVITQEKLMSLALVYLCSALFCAGFCLWLMKHALRIVRVEQGRLAIAFLHAGVLVGAYIGSRWIVALVTGLPSKDFDGTVAVTAIVCAALLYLALLAFACFAVAVGCLLLAPVFESAWIASKVPATIRIRAWLARRLGMRFFEQLDVEKSPTSIQLTAHWFAGMMTATFVGYALQFAMDASINDSRLMKHLAYYVDYQTADRYPGVNLGQRFVLHDNNIVSFARLVDGRVEIAVGVIEPLEGVRSLSAYR